MDRLSFSTKIILGLAVIALTIGYFSLPWGTLFRSPAQPGVVGCTKEAMACPDGSSVSRIPPRCEFLACPFGVATNEFLVTESIPNPNCGPSGSIAMDSDSQHAIEASLTPAMKQVLDTYLDSDWLFSQGCSVAPGIYAFSLYSVERSKSLTENMNVERELPNNLIVAFKVNGGKTTAYTAQKFNPSSGDIGLCSIDTLAPAHLDFTCGGGDGPSGWAKMYRLPFDGSALQSLQDCTLGENASCQ